MEIDTAWIDAALADVGRARTSAVQVFRDMPWATVAHLQTNVGRAWFKANHPTFAYEAELLRLLDRIAPGTVLKPLAVHEETGWFLADDAGPTADETAAPGMGVEVAQVYARVQTASAGAIAEILAAGVPDRRPATLLPLFDAALDNPAASRSAARCRALRARFRDACQLLEADGRLALANGDLKLSHAFAGPPIRLFDWGDAVVSHPLVSVGTARRGLGEPAEHGDPAVLIANAWRSDIDSELVVAATAVAGLLNADVWLRDPPGALEMFPDAVNRSLSRLADTLETQTV